LDREKTAAVTIEIKLYCGYCVNQLVTCNECRLVTCNECQFVTMNVNAIAR